MRTTLLHGPQYAGSCIRDPSENGFPKIRGTMLGVPIIRTIVFWGIYWGSLI